MPCKINNNSNFDITEIEDLLQDLFSFSQNRLGFKRNPSLNFISDENNASPLGKTAYYDPSALEITIYVDGRHPKDIMRSFSHELVHHNQNENGMFDQMNNTGAGYAQSDPYLRKMEKEAYLKGNMCFRDWEDGYKSSNPNILNERRIYKMSTKKWKDKELNGLLNERWGFSMNLGKLNEGCAEEQPAYEENQAYKKDDKETVVMKESDQTQQEMADMIKQSDKSADEIAAQIIARFFDSIRPEDEAPPSDDFDGGNSGAPAQPSLQEQEEVQTDDKLKGTSGGRYTTKDPELTQKVQDLAIGIIKNPSLIKSLTGIETIIQNMVGALGTSEKTLSQTKTDMAKAQSDLQEKKLRQSIRKILKEKMKNENKNK